MENNKNDWGKIKEDSKELKNAASIIFGALIFGVAMLVGIWAFVEAIFQVTLTFTQAILITAGVGGIYLLKSWWSNRQTNISIEDKSNQNQNTKDSPKQKAEKVEMQFVPTLYPEMEKQWGAPKTAEQLRGTSPKKAPTSNEPSQDNQTKLGSDSEFRVVFHEKNPSNQKNDDNA